MNTFAALASIALCLIVCVVGLAQAGGDKSAKTTVITLAGGGGEKSSGGYPIPIPIPVCAGKMHGYGGGHGHGGGHGGYQARMGWRRR